MRKKIFQENIKIISNNKIIKNYFKVVLRPFKITRLAKPGQFLEIKISNGYEPLLRRPFSIHHVSDFNIEILYEILGKGTEILSQRKAGEYLDVIGPLGNGFNYRLPITDSATRHGGSANIFGGYRLPILVAGGMGVAPLIFLAEKLKGRKAIVLIGAKTKSQILCEKEFKNLGCEVKIATDDGSKGFKGRVTDLLKSLLSTINYQLSTIYACGPKPMLKEIARISQKYKIPTQVSLEEHLACGIGACLGCVVKTKEGYKRVCMEGPIFSTDEIVW